MTAECFICGDIIESVDRRVDCKCGESFLDASANYQKAGGYIKPLPRKKR
jgi:acetone carboxylase gamma subunit